MKDGTIELFIRDNYASMFSRCMVGKDEGWDYVELFIRDNYASMFSGCMVGRLDGFIKRKMFEKIKEMVPVESLTTPPSQAE